MNEDVYFSCDIESDGPIPGTDDYSMLSIAFSVAGIMSSDGFHSRPPRQQTFYVELKPISHNFDADAVAVVAEGGLNREELLTTGSDPKQAMSAAANWINEVAGARQPVFLAYPLGFDWSFSHYYFIRFNGSDPFGFGNALDIRTIYQHKTGCLIEDAKRDQMPEELLPTTAATHNALDDAIAQAELLQNILNWNAKNTSD